MSYVVSGIETGYGSYHPRVVGMGSSGSRTLVVLSEARGCVPNL